MKPYYQHNGITIYHERCEAALAHIEDNSVDLIFNDPPYFRVKNEPWDRQWDTSKGFIAWMGEQCAQWKRVLKPNGSLFVCASPDMSARVEIEIAKHFNVLNNIRWIKDQGWHKKADEEALRSFLSPWESVIFAEQYGDQYEDAARALHLKVYAPIGRHIQLKRMAAGIDRAAIDIACSPSRKPTGLCYRWESGDCLPTLEQFILICQTCGDRREYEDLRREYEDLRRVFNADKISTDIWNYPTVPPAPGKHPCEKPLAMLEDVIRATTKPGAVVLDCFAGSGTTLRAAKNTGRRAIGIEMSERWCDYAAGRVGQETMFDLLAA